MVKAKSNETDAQKIVRLRDEEELGWGEVAEQMGIGAGKCQVLYFRETLDPKDKVSFKDDEDAANKIVRLRDKEGVSWGIIGVRMGIPESKVRRLYEEKTGKSTRGNRIGKGGRYPADGAPAKKAVAKKAAASKKAAKATKATKAAKKAAAEPQKVTGEVAKKSLTSMKLPELQARLNGKTITLDRDGNLSKIKVKAIRSLKDNEVVLTDQGGKSRTVLVTEIKSATK